MVYSSRFVLSVLVDGKPQRELANGVVPIQFGREYALRFRNKNDRRAVVKFTVDGENVSGNGYIIPANSSIDILRHWDKDATFRFVDLDSPEAVDHGKNGPNLDGSKGVIEAKFYLEKAYIPPVKVPQPIHHHHHHYHERKWTDPWPNQWPNLNNPYVPPSSPMTWCSTGKGMSSGPAPASTANYSADIPKSINLDAANIPTSINFTMPPQNAAMPPINVPPLTFPCTDLKEGCTVEGGRSGQTFTTQWIDLETDYVLLRCSLKGMPHMETYTPTSSGEYCTNCGAKRARAADNFCGVCGRKL